MQWPYLKVHQDSSRKKGWRRCAGRVHDFTRFSVAFWGQCPNPSTPSNSTLCYLSASLTTIVTIVVRGISYNQNWPSFHGDWGGAGIGVAVFPIHLVSRGLTTFDSNASSFGTDTARTDIALRSQAVQPALLASVPRFAVLFTVRDPVA